MGSKILNFFKRLSVTKKVILCILAFLVTGYIFCLPRHLFHVPYSTVVTDRNEELLGARIASDGQWRFPPRNTTPEKIKECLITFEDKHFYHHWGVNPFAIGRAFYQNVKNKRIVSGGSTLTMQTIRLARNESRTFREKLIEMIWATRLEFRASKEEILSMYISHAPFGGNVVGLDAAAWRYFGHSADDLSWAESAMLAVLPNAPAMIHLSKGRKTLLDKRNRLLKQLLEKKTIDSSTYELAISEPLPDEPHPLPQIAPYLVSRFYQERNGEYSRSTINKGIQTQIEDLAERWSNEFRRSDIRNLAILVIDIPSNQVVAYCGNVHFDQKQGGNQVDVIQAPRSTGSILKPFLYYAMLQEGSLLPDMLLPDVPVNINGFTPQNFSMQFEGAVPASEALARSLNIPAVTMLQRYGVPKFHSFLQQVGLKTINRSSSHYGLSLILGGAEATLWDVTNAYAMMGRSLLQLPQRSCSLLLPTSRITESTDPFQPGAVWQTFDALKEVNRPEEIDWKSIPSMQTIAWKTGTSYGFRDAWAVGVNPEYVIGVWVGNADGEGRPGLIGVRAAAPILFEVASLVRTDARFYMPKEELSAVAVCRKSGYRASSICPEIDTVYVARAGEKTEVCPYHRLVNLDRTGKFRVDSECESVSRMRIEPWFVLSPVQEWYYARTHSDYKKLPPYRADCQRGQDDVMEMIYPQRGLRVFIPKDLGGVVRGVVFEMAHREPSTLVYWHIDDQFLGTTRYHHQLEVNVAPGRHTLYLVDAKGNSLRQSFVVVDGEKDYK